RRPRCAGQGVARAGRGDGGHQRGAARAAASPGRTRLVSGSPSVAIEEILDLEQLEINIYRGGVFSPESGFLQRTFGGHVAGQSLVSAVRTVDPRYQVHSLHGYFLRPGDAKASTVFIVERIRDGGSFVTRRVNAIQHGESIFSMSASFQADQEGIHHQD